jgi:predicted enzyme related to lactoylglutathione lyase
VPNPLCHFELMSNDPERARAFYGTVFDWEFDDQAMAGYTLINAGAEPSGGMMAKPAGAPHAALNVYFLVEDVPATLEKVEAAGGSVLVPRTEIPNVGTFAMIADPEGVVIGLLKPAS